MDLAAPAALGRGVVIPLGGNVPRPWRDAEHLTVDPATLDDPVAAVERLTTCWAQRLPVVIELGVDLDTLRTPREWHDPLWQLGPRFLPWLDRLHFLCWANTYDARRPGQLRWWWAARAERLGAHPVESGPGDVVLGDGRPAWIDGGPRQPLDPAVLGAAVVHRETVELDRLTPQPAEVPVTAELDPGQRAAVGHHSGPARVLAPAGSGKTRVLTERLRLLHSRGWEREAVLAVAYNVRARAELEARTTDLAPRVQTLNSLGYAILREQRPDLRLLDERAVRGLVERLVTDLVGRKARRANTDPLQPYLEALSLARLGLRSPASIEDERDDVPGLAAVLPRYRAALADGGAIDYDEQIYGAIELLVGDGPLRREAQARWGRHLLVDEFQDLTPAHVLLLRLLAAPALDVFGVGDDDQVIYGHAGADPAFLLDYGQLFPGADEHLLGVNYRCPVVVVRAARTLLAYNRRRVDKPIEAGPDANDDRDALQIHRHPPDGRVAAVVEAVGERLARGAAPAEVAVLARVNAGLIAPRVGLAHAGVPVSSGSGSAVLGRTGTRAALAYLRIATAPGGAAEATDIVEILRRPSRGLPQWFPDRLARRARWTPAQVAAIAGGVPDTVAPKVERLAADLARVVAAGSGDTRSVLRVIREEVGLGGAATLLDRTKGVAGGSHLDDLTALEDVAALLPDPATFEERLRSALDLPTDPSGVVLATVHKVKGQEWDHIVVVGVDDGVLPHRLADDLEEERRVLHVAITRCRRDVTVLARADAPSPFLDELLGLASKARAEQPRPGSAPPSGRSARSKGRAAGSTPQITARPGLALEVLGGYRGKVAELTDDGVVLALARGGRLHVRWGEHVRVDEPGGPSGPLASRSSTGEGAADGCAEARTEALRAWRRERCRADGVPAYVILSDRHLEGIAARRPTTLDELLDCPGIGPTKLDSFGDEILEVLAAVTCR